jgi:hypothetical protein
MGPAPDPTVSTTAPASTSADYPYDPTDNSSDSTWATIYAYYKPFIGMQYAQFVLSPDPPGVNLNKQALFAGDPSNPQQAFTLSGTWGRKTTDVFTASDANAVTNIYTAQAKKQEQGISNPVGSLLSLPAWLLDPGHWAGVFAILGGAALAAVGLWFTLRGATEGGAP